MQAPFRLFRSSIGKKILMALTGAVLVGYLIAHMAGNLQVFAGRDVINGYSAMLHEKAGLLWGVRALLLTAVVVHIVTATSLAKANLAARPVRYAVKKSVSSSLASRTMILSGPVILVFILFHLAHLTLGWNVVPPEHVEGDVYTNLINGFHVGWVALFYVVAVSLVGLHLVHGAWSLVRTLGVEHPRYDSVIKGVAQTVSVVVALGFIAVPVSIFVGLLGGPPAAALHDNKPAPMLGQR